MSRVFWKPRCENAAVAEPVPAARNRARPCGVERYRAEEPMAVRPSWTGHLRLSLVTCPVALYKAVEARTGTHFHLINPRTNQRIHQVAKDASTGREVDRKSLVKGFEVSKGKYVLIDPGDLDALKL